MIKVYNVGQGDAFLFKPNQGSLKEENFLIDTGYKNKHIYKRISNDVHNVIITHSDEDHLNGLSDVLINKDIKNLYIPYYLPEIIVIHNYLKNAIKIKKGIASLPYSKMKGLTVHLLKDGDIFEKDSNIQVFNPPIDSLKLFDSIDSNYLNEGYLMKVVGKLNEYNIDLELDAILNYKSEVLEYIQGEEKLKYQENSKKFISAFFVSLYPMLFESGDNELTDEYIKLFLKEHYTQTKNAISIVFKYQDNKTSYLFTGDAEEETFNRIFLTQFNEKILKANILKMPHHGSKKNITERILKLINPKKVLVSHGNRHNHPSEEVLFLLKKLKIKSYYTNDVIKRGKVVIKKTIGRIDSDIEFSSLGVRIKSAKSQGIRPYTRNKT